MEKYPLAHRPIMKLDKARRDAYEMVRNRHVYFK